MANKFNILTINGGGIRGIISSTLLNRLSQSQPDFISNINMLGGTSTGSIIAAALAYEMPVQEIEKFYSVENCEYIFSYPRSPILRPKYNPSNLLDVLKRVFPEDLTLNDLKKTIVIPTFSLGDSTSGMKPILYSNLPGSPTGSAKVLDVVMASSSAPVYLPPYQNQIDGGVVAYDPSLICLLHALSRSLDVLPLINLLSVGTGISKTSSAITEDSSNWGATQWNLSPETLRNPLLEICITSNAALSFVITRELLKQRYYKLDLQFDGNISLDDYTKIPHLKTLSENHDISKSISWLKNFWI